MGPAGRCCPSVQWATRLLSDKAFNLSGRREMGRNTYGLRRFTAAAGVSLACRLRLANELSRSDQRSGPEPVSMAMIAATPMTSSTIATSSVSEAGNGLSP